MMYFLVPIKKNLTLVFAGGKKLLFNASKKRTESILKKYLNKKISKSRGIYDEYLGNLVVNNFDISRKTRTLKNEEVYSSFIFITDSENWMSKDFLKRISVRPLEHYLKLNNINNKVDSKKPCIIVGRIFDEAFLEKIKKNKKKIENLFCLLIGLEDFYFFRISDDICFDCLRTRRVANLSNMSEIILAEKYLYKIGGSNVFIDELFGQATRWLAGLSFSKTKKEKIIVYKKKDDRFYESRLIPFPLCVDCEGDIFKKPLLMRDLLDRGLGLFSFFPKYSKKINNQKLHIFSSQISQIAPVVQLELYKKQKSFKRITKFFINNLNKFSISRPVICGAVSLSSPKTAEIKATSESMERYAAILFDDSNLIKKSFCSCEDEAVGPRDWVLYSNEQYDLKEFPFKKFSEKIEINWAEGTSLISGKKRLVPASFVYIRYPLLDIGIYPTTGLACGRNDERVIMGGICENFERDACMLTWLLKIPPRRIVNISNKKINNILYDFSIEGIEINLFEVSLDFNLPVILAIGINKGNVGDCPKVLIGSSCNAKKDEAIIKSIEELGQGFSWIHLMKRYRNYDFGKNFKNITHFEHRAIFYATLTNLSILDFILNTKRKIDYNKIKTGIKKEGILQMIKKSGYDTIEINLTKADIQSAGYTVKKIMIPGLQPLSSNHNLNFFDRKRMNKVIKYLKRRKIFYSKDINLLPHPFT